MSSRRCRGCSAPPAPRHAVRDLEQQVSAHVAANFQALAGDHNVGAELAAERVNEALRGVEAAVREREVLAQQATALWRWVAQPRPNLTPASHCEQLARDIATLIMRGGERPALMPTSYLPQNAAVEPPEPEAPVADGPAADYLARALGAQP